MRVIPQGEIEMATQKNETGVKVGDVLFGQVNGYPPARWKFDGVRNGSCCLSNVRHPSQSTSYPDQFVSWDEIRRLAAH